MDHVDRGKAIQDKGVVRAKVRSRAPICGAVWTDRTEAVEG